MKIWITTAIFVCVIVNRLTPTYAQEKTAQADRTIEPALRVIHNVSKRDRIGLTVSVTCGLMPSPSSFQQAEAALIISPEGKIDGASRRIACRVKQLLKSQGKLSFQPGDRVIVEDLPAQTKSQSYILLCRQTDEGKLESFEWERLSEQAERFVVRLRKFESDEKRLPFLFEHESSDDDFIWRFAFAELSDVSHETFQNHASVLPAELILRRALPMDSEDVGGFFLSRRGTLYLKLLPLVAELEDFQKLEDLIFRSPELDNFLRAPFVDPYVALANRKQLRRLSATFVPPTKDEQDRVGIDMVYFTYRAFREHYSRPELADVRHEVSRKLVAANHRLTEIILNDYRQMSDWRFVDEANRILSEKQASPTFRRVSVTYLLQAHRDAVRSGNRELAEKVEQCVSSVEQADPKLVRIARRLVDIQNEPPRSKQPQ